MAEIILKKPSTKIDFEKIEDKVGIEDEIEPAYTGSTELETDPSILPYPPESSTDPDDDPTDSPNASALAIPDIEPVDAYSRKKAA